MRKHLFGAGLLASALLAGASSSASAFQIFDTTVDSCTGTNCGAVVLGGTVNGFSPTAGPWIGSIFGNAGCLRLDVTSQGTTDLEIVAVAPNGSVFRNDDRAGGDLRPLVKITNAVNGWYTVSISQFAGTAVQSNFTLAMGRYSSSGNPNCAGATPPTSPAAASAAKTASGVNGPAIVGGPGSR
jgi:hypothetical protein